jgi:hypothetical protein
MAGIPCSLDTAYVSGVFKIAQKKVFAWRSTVRPVVREEHCSWTLFVDTLLITYWCGISGEVRIPTTVVRVAYSMSGGWTVFIFSIIGQRQERTRSSRQMSCFFHSSHVSPSSRLIFDTMSCINIRLAPRGESHFSLTQVQGRDRHD